MSDCQDRELITVCRRGIDHTNLLSDITSHCLFYGKQDSLHGLTDAIQKTPLNSSYQSWLSDYFSREWCFAIYHFTTPTVLVFNWGHGDLRYFLVTNEGYIIEPEFFSHWDSYFSFIDSDSASGSLLLNLSRAKEHDLPAESLIWFPFSSNYTHFLFDSLGPVLGISEEIPSFLNKRFSLLLPSASIISPWQEQWLSSLRQPRRSHLNPLSDMSLNIFRPREVMMPIASNPAISLRYLSQSLNRYVVTGIAPECRSRLRPRLILLTRSDYRRARIRNLEALESFVVRAGGVVVDIAKLLIEDRIRLFDSTCICIAESSGCMNFAIYSNQTSRLVALVDGATLNDGAFVLGGWRYAVGYMHRALYVVGLDSGPLHGSPLGSSFYPIEAVAQAIEDSRGIIASGHQQAQ